MRPTQALRQIKGMTKEMKTRKPQQPRLSDVMESFYYKPVMLDLVLFFKGAHMPGVAKHLEAACREIDHIWEEDRFDSAT